MIGAVAAVGLDRVNAMWVAGKLKHYAQKGLSAVRAWGAYGPVRVRVADVGRGNCADQFARRVHSRREIGPNGGGTRIRTLSPP